MESKISKLKGIHSFSPLHNLDRKNGFEVAVQRFLDSFGRTLYGTLGFTMGTRGFFRVGREFSVLAEAPHASAVGR